MLKFRPVSSKKKWQLVPPKFRMLKFKSVIPAAFEKGRLNIDKKGTPSMLGKYLGHIK
jgi:hypothetical protein